MSDVLQGVTAVIGVVLVLALAAQSLQEVLKTMFVVKGNTALASLRALVGEAARATGRWQVDEKQIADAIVGRLGRLGQKGWKGVRLDVIPRETLRDLIVELDVSKVPSVKSLGDAAGPCLEAIAAKAEKWYDLSIGAVDDRYKRRMRVFVLGTSAAVVLALNADALWIVRRAMHDEQWRTTIVNQVTRIDSLYRAARSAGACDQADTTAGAPCPATDTTAVRDSLDTRLAALIEDRGVIGRPGGWRTRDGEWWLGIVLMTLLVSLGAPFWHDLLESVFSFKAKARNAARPPGGEA